MGRVIQTIDARARAFITAQRVFFVATAPAGGDGHVNVSPKGLDSFRVLADRRVAYLDYIGSGAETIAHLRENGRITIMFTAFDGLPNILRVYGRGHVLEPQDPGYAALLPLFTVDTMPRAVICVDVERVSDSCGFGVPLYRYEGERSQLVDSSEKRGEEGLRQYQRERNARSLDGLPALKWVEG